MIAPPTAAAPTEAALQAAVSAQPSWRRIELLSDLHLTPSMPQTLACFLGYLEQSQADAIFILGDLFEVWIGDDVADDRHATEVMAALKIAAHRRFVAVMVGNRDFLMSPAFLVAHGIVPLHDPTVLTAFGRNTVLSHGDALCLDDEDYQRFRLRVRSPAWQANFLQQPRSTRASMARDMRDASMARQPAGPVTWADADPQMSMAWLHALGSNTLIHGHTHRPQRHVPAVAGATEVTVRYVLSDWDLDAPRPRASVLQWREDGVHVLTVNADGSLLQDI